MMHTYPSPSRTGKSSGDWLAEARIRLYWMARMWKLGEETSRIADRFATDPGTVRATAGYHRGLFGYRRERMG